MQDLRLKFSLALEKRSALLEKLHRENTNCYRLFHGAVEGCPGISIDRYASTLLIQTWRTSIKIPVEEVHHLAEQSLQCKLNPVWNDRSVRGQVVHKNSAEPDGNSVGKELGLFYDVRPQHQGIDPLLFLDFRSGRRWMYHNAKGRSVLNLFAYTCGIGVAALCGGAQSVLNVDFSHRSLEIGEKNAERNGLDLARFQTLKENVFPVVRQFSGLGIRGRAARKKYTRLKPQNFDLVVLDPPRLSKSPFGKVDLVSDYASLFKPALLCTQKGGTLLVTNNVASVVEKDWHDILARCARKAGRPLKSITPLRPEEDFPSPDQKWPLKIAIVQTE